MAGQAGRWVVFALLLLAGAGLAEAATFSCEIRTSCLSNQTLLLRLNSSDTGAAPNNSHAQLANFSGTAYPYSVCCWTDAFRALTNTCEMESTTILRLAATTDSHVQAASGSGYVFDACYNVTAGNISCEYPNSACAPGHSSVVSIASSEAADGNLTNAHVGDPNLYLRKVCCRIGGQNPPTVEYANLTPINTTKNTDLRCENGTVSDPDGDAVTLHYNWYVNGTSIAALNMPMDYDDVGGITHDISGYANHGTVNGATFLPVGGTIGGGFSFDGTNDYINIGNDSELNFGTGAFTIALWVYSPDTGSYGKSIIQKMNGTTGIAGYRVFKFSVNQTAFNISDGSSSAQLLVAPGNFDSAFEHYVFTRNASGMHAYVNGIAGASTAAGGSLNVNTLSPVLFGANASLADAFLNGQLDEVMIFNRSLTANDVRTLYNGGNKYLNRSELTKTDYWNCSVTPVDSTGLNGTTAYSNRTYVSPSTPTNTTLLYPANGNATVFERFVNLSWTAQEPDGDQVNYTINLTVAPGACSVQAIISNIQTQNYTYGELCTDQTYWWNVSACDVDGCASVNQTFNFTIASVLSIRLTNNNTQFGSLATGQSLTTESYAVTPFLVENDGNVFANVTLVGNNSPFTSAALGTSAFQFKAADNETGSINTTGSQTTYTPVPSAWTHAIRQLNYSNASDVAAIHINVTVPGDEPPGEKRGNLTFRGVAS